MDRSAGRKSSACTGTFNQTKCKYRYIRNSRILLFLSTAVYTNFIIKTDNIFILFCNVFIGTVCMHVYFYDTATSGTKFNRYSKHGNMMYKKVSQQNTFHYINLKKAQYCKSSGRATNIHYRKMLFRQIFKVYNKVYLHLVYTINNITIYMLSLERKGD